MLYSEYLTTLDECPFCARRNKVILDDEEAYLTYAIAPYHQHHLLIIPKRHTESVQDLSPAERGSVLRLEHRALDALKKLGYRKISLLVREGESDLRTVAHVHYHVIPEVNIHMAEHVPERAVLTLEEIDATIRDISAQM